MSYLKFGGHILYCLGKYLAVDNGICEVEAYCLACKFQRLKRNLTVRQIVDTPCRYNEPSYAVLRCIDICYRRHIAEHCQYIGHVHTGATELGYALHILHVQILLAGGVLALERLIQAIAHCTSHFQVVGGTCLVQAELVEHLVETCTLGHLARICIWQQNVVCHLLHLAAQLAHRACHSGGVDER